MELFWYIVIAITLVIFFILDGYDFGTGIIHIFFARKEEDKKVIAKAAGLFWDSNEVWLVATGGLLFMAFPTLYASAFSGFYLPLIIILWLIIFRATGLEFRNQFSFQMWKDFWDKCFGISSLLLAFFFGVSLGNIVRGVNLGGVTDGVSSYEGQYFFLPLFNAQFSPLSDRPGVFDWFTVLIGLISVLTLTIHGANWIILKTNSSINDKLLKVIVKLNASLALLSIITLLAHHSVKSISIKNFIDIPVLMIFPTLYTISLIALFFVHRFKSQKTGFIFSSTMIFSGISTTALSLFPVLLSSTNSVHPHLTIYNSSSNDYSLASSIYWGILGIILIIVYMIIQKRLLSGKIDKLSYEH